MSSRPLPSSRQRPSSHLLACRRFLAGLAAAAVLSPRFLAAAEEPVRSPAARDEVSVTVVEIPVEVHRRGEPVRGLAAEDFAVYQGDRRLPLVAFETIDLEATGATVGAAAATARDAVPAAGRRHVLFLFDLAYSSDHQAQRSVAGARQVVASGLHPSDLVAIALYMPSGDTPVPLQFTTDRAAATLTLESIEALLRGEEVKPAEGGGDPLRVTGASPGELLAQTATMAARNHQWEALSSLGPSGTSGGDAGPSRGNRGSWGAFLIRNILSHGGTLAQAEVAERERAYARNAVAALGSLTASMGGVEGRKILYYFTAGFALGGRTPAASVQNPSGAVSSLLSPFGALVEDLRRSGWVVDPVDAAGLREYGGPSDAMHFVALETGGQVVRNDNDLGRAVATALRRHTVSYLLAVDAGAVPPDGTFHPLEVRLVGEAAGARALHRSGYYAPLPLAQQAEERRMTDAAVLLAAGVGRDDLGISLAPVVLRGADDVARVPVVVEVPGPTLADRGERALEIYGYAFDTEGGGKDFFATAVELDPERVGERLRGGGVRYLGELALVPGDYDLRVLVRARPSGRTSLLALPLHVGARDEVMSGAAQPLFLPAEGDAWITVRQEGAALTVHGRGLLPSLEGALAAGGHADLVLLGEGLTAGGATLGARVLTAEGRPAGDGAFEVLSVAGGEGSDPDLVIGRLHARDLPPGRYLLELRRSVPGRDAISRGAFVVAARGGAG